MRDVSKCDCGAMIGDHVKTSLKWVTRTLVYSSLGFILFIFARNGSEWTLTEQLLECKRSGAGKSAAEVLQCIKDRSGFFATLFLSDARAMSYLAPVTPCKYIGKWRSIRPEGEYQIELAQGGQFIGEPAPGYSGDSVQGTWSVVGTSIQWVYNSPFQPWRPDTNPIVDEQPGEFVLIEENGMRTLFRRMDRESQSHRTCVAPG
jgi:hypothetical protein